MEVVVVILVLQHPMEAVVVILVLQHPMAELLLQCSQPLVVEREEFL
jgi:hypothetical protein